MARVASCAHLCKASWSWLAHSARTSPQPTGGRLLRGGVVDGDGVLVVTAERGHGRPRDGGRRAGAFARSAVNDSRSGRRMRAGEFAPHVRIGGRRWAWPWSVCSSAPSSSCSRRTPDTRDAPSGDSRAGVVFSNAQSGTCLSWPADSPDKPSFVQCRDDHMFEVAKAVDMSNFDEPCQAAVRQYLGRPVRPE